MKTVIKILILSAISTSIIYTQWNKLPIATDADLINLFFISEEVGWIVGRDAALLKTTDGGNTWIAQQPGMEINFNTIFFTDEETGWAGGSDGKIIKTDDGGSNWYCVNSGTINSISSLYFINNQHGFAAVNKWSGGRAGWILETDDGGETWCESIHTGGYGYIDINFSDQFNGLAIGSNGLVLKTYDGGICWEKQNTRTSHWLFSVFSIGIDNIWVSGGGDDRDIIIKSGNGGFNWTNLRSTSLNGRLTGCQFINENVGWVCGKDGVILKTENGGNDWIREYAEVNGDLHKIFIVGNVGYAVGDRGTVLKNHYTSIDKKLKLLAPNGDEEWVTGSLQKITWESEGVRDVKIEYSYNNGASWNVIQSSYPSTGIFNWNVPNIISNQAKIKISDKNSSGLSVESNSYFKIISKE